MRILVDLRSCQTPPPRGGVAVYAEQLVRALLAATSSKPQAPSRIEWALFVNGIVDPRTYLPKFDSPSARWVVGRWPNKVFNAACSLQLAACSFAADVVFLPNLNFLPPLPARTRLVVTVHDLSFEHFPDCFTWKQRLWHRMIQPRKLLARADAIIAVSETTKRDVIETYDVDASTIHVVYPGIDTPGEVGKQFFSPLPDRGGSACPPKPWRRRERGWSTRTLPERFILSLSAIEPRKNHDGLIAALEHLTPYTLRLTPPLHLVIAGNHGSAERALCRQIARSPARDRIHLIGPVSEDEKRALLARASCFVYPSLWEGFGFPPLEAMAAGCPVVASTGGALLEVLGDAVRLVDPLDPAAIADAIARIIADNALRTDLIARGRARAAQFTWKNATRQVAALLGVTREHRAADHTIDSERARCYR